MQLMIVQVTPAAKMYFLNTLQNTIFFFNVSETSEIYTLSLHDALPISPSVTRSSDASSATVVKTTGSPARSSTRSEEHTSELQSRVDIVYSLLLEKKKENIIPPFFLNKKKKKKKHKKYYI